MYFGSIDKAISANLITTSDVATEIKNRISPENEINRTFINRRKLVAFKYLCQVDPKLALDVSEHKIIDKSLLRTIWLLMVDDQINIDGCGPKLAKIITGKCIKLETEHFSYYIEAGNDLKDIPLNLMTLETCVDVDRVADLLTYLPQLESNQKKIVINRMVDRFCRLRSGCPDYFYKCMLEEYLDFFRRFVTEPDLLSCLMIRDIQKSSDGKFLDGDITEDFDEYKLLIRRCNNRTITRILGIKLHSSVPDIEHAIDDLKKLGVDEYYTQLHSKFKEKLDGIKIRNDVDLHFSNFYEYHPDDLILVDRYMFSGPEFNNLLSTGINPYTRQPIPKIVLEEIKSKIPQPVETMKELCVKYLS